MSDTEIGYTVPLIELSVELPIKVVRSIFVLWVLSRIKPKYNATFYDIH